MFDHGRLPAITDEFDGVACDLGERTVVAVTASVAALLGVSGVATSDLAPHGLAHVKGEVWTASTAGGTIRQGEAVQVVRVEGLRLWVVKKQQDEEKKP